MAVQVLSEFSAALSLRFGPELMSSINRVAVLAYLLPIVDGEGKALNWTAQFTGAANATASAEGVARSSTDADAELEVAATLGWAQYDKVSSVSHIAQSAVATTPNPESAGSAGLDLLMGRIRDQIPRVALGVATHLYSGNPSLSPTQLAGAALAIDSSGTFAGIDPTTYTEWASVEQIGPIAGLTQATVRNWLSAIYDSCGFMPEFVTCPSSVFNRLRDLYSDYESNTRVTTITTMRGGGVGGDQPRVIDVAKAGIEALLIDGVPFVRDRHCTANTMYAWNTQYVEIHQLNHVRSVLQGGEDAIQALFQRLNPNEKMVLPRAEVEGMLARTGGIRPYIQVLGNRGLSQEAVVAWQGQVKWKRRNGFGKYTFTL